MGNADSVIKSSVLEGFRNSGDVSWTLVLLTLAISFVLGLLIYFIYKRTFAGVVYQRTFGLSLVMLTMVTSVVILTISSNLMLSLGMVGALSIVRFRTAVKDPLDTVYMFWAIATGIVVGAKLWIPALIASAAMSILMVVLSLFKNKKHMPYLLVIRFEEAAKADVQNLLRKFPQGKLKSKTVSRGVIELTLEMSIQDAEISLMDRFGSIPGVYDASLVSYSGDIVS